MQQPAAVKIEMQIKQRSLYADYFFVSMASLFIVFAVVGFGQDYRLIYAQHIAIYWFAHVHGIILTAWLLIFLMQAILVAKGNLRFHRQLGLFSVVLGALVWISMSIVIFHTHIGYPIHKDISWSNVLFLFLTMSLFGLFFTWGIIKRKNAGAHKRLLFLATLVLISAGFNRVLFSVGVNPTLSWLPLRSAAAMPAFLLYNDLLLIPLFIYDFITVRHIHKTTIIAVGCIIGAHLVITVVWRLLS